MGLFNLLQSSFTSVVSVCAELLLVRRFLHNVLLISISYSFIWLLVYQSRILNWPISRQKGTPEVFSFPVFTPQGYSGKYFSCPAEYLTYLCFSIY